MKRKECFVKELDHLKDNERLYFGPFSLYDSEELKAFEKKVRKMDSSIEHDEEKVECCEGCKSLFIYKDDFNNWWCGKCNSLNSIEECKNIEEYLENYGHIWT